MTCCRHVEVEELLARMRALLREAHEAERAREFQKADALGARAANALAHAVHLQRDVIPWRRP